MSVEEKSVEVNPVEEKSVEVKPVEVKPVEVKPVEVKPVEILSPKQVFQKILEEDYKYSRAVSSIAVVPIRIKRIQECYEFITVLMNKPITTRLEKINEEKMLRKLVGDAMDHAEELKRNFKEIVDDV